MSSKSIYPYSGRVIKAISSFTEAKAQKGILIGCLWFYKDKIIATDTFSAVIVDNVGAEGLLDKDKVWMPTRGAVDKVLISDSFSFDGPMFIRRRKGADKEGFELQDITQDAKYMVDKLIEWASIESDEFNQTAISATPSLIEKACAASSSIGAKSMRMREVKYCTGVPLIVIDFRGGVVPMRVVVAGRNDCA